MNLSQGDKHLSKWSNQPTSSNHHHHHPSSGGTYLPSTTFFLRSPPSSPSMQRFTFHKFLVYTGLVFLSCLVLYSWVLPCNDPSKARMVPKDQMQFVYDQDNKAYPYDRNMPLIFIGGVPRSGTTLMRAMLDAHPEVRCGEETRVIPRLLGMRGQWARSPRESKRLVEAGLTDEVIDSALAAFILEVIAKHGAPAPHLCNKDPFTLKSSVYLSQMFPNGKFILMVRDGRAVVHSIITRKVTITGFDLKSFRNCLQKWNQAMEVMYYQCLRVGAGHCMLVYYEQLVLHPKQWLDKILQFLEIPWDDSVLHHEEFINKPNGVSLSKTERSTDQVIKPVNLEALSKWVHTIPEDVKRDISMIAPMLEKLGYDPHANPPKYGDPDRFVADNTAHIKNNEDFWRKKGQEVLFSNNASKKAGGGGGANKPTLPAAAQIYKDSDNGNNNKDGGGQVEHAGEVDESQKGR